MMFHDPGDQSLTAPQVQYWKPWDVFFCPEVVERGRGDKIVLTRVVGYTASFRYYRRWIDPWWLWLRRRF